MMSRPSLPQFLWTLQSTQSNKITTELATPPEDQHGHTTNHHTPGVLPQKHTSSSNVRIMNRSMVLPWVLPLIPSLLFMEALKSRPSALPHRPHLWLRYVNDTLVIQQAKHNQQLLQHINPQEPHIQFTIDEPNQEGALPVLHIFVSPCPNNTLITTVNRKPTHTQTNIYTGTVTTLSQHEIVFSTF